MTAQTSEEKRISDDFDVCKTIRLTADSESSRLIDAGQIALQDARNILDQASKIDNFHSRLSAATDKLEALINELIAAKEQDPNLWNLKYNLVVNFKALYIMICGKDNAVNVTPLDQEIERARQALAAEQERTGHAFPQIDKLVFDSCDQLSAAAKSNSQPDFRASVHSLHNVVNFVDSFPAPPVRPVIDLNSLLIGAALGVGSVFTILLVGYLVSSGRNLVCKFGIFSGAHASSNANYRRVNSCVKDVRDSDTELDLELEETETPRLVG
jgi:hypothetical protein